MEKTTVYIIRHGQTSGNKENKYIGNVDIGITELGERQAEMTAKHLYGSVKFDAVYSSDLIRAYLTALPTATMQGLSVQKERGLRELYGGEWENLTFPEIIERFPQGYKTWKTDYSIVHPDGGESVSEMAERVYGTVKKIVKENAGKTVAIFTHGGPIRTLVCKLSGKPLSEINDIPWATNTSITIAEFIGDEVTLIQAQKDDHLGSDMVTSFKD